MKVTSFPTITLFWRHRYSEKTMQWQTLQKCFGFVSPPATKFFWWSTITMGGKKLVVLSTNIVLIKKVSFKILHDAVKEVLEWFKINKVLVYFALQIGNYWIYSFMVNIKKFSVQCTKLNRYKGTRLVTPLRNKKMNTKFIQ